MSSITELHRLLEGVSKHLKTGVGHLKEMITLAPKATSAFSGLPGAGGSTGVSGGSLMSGSLGSFSAPMASGFGGQNFLAPSLAAISTPPSGGGQQGFQSGIGMQALPTGQGTMLNAGMLGALFSGRGGALSPRMSGILTALGVAGAAGGVLIRAAGAGLPDVEETIGRRTNYYQAAVRGSRSILEVENATFQGLGAGLTSRGSDALVAAALLNQGMAFSADPNSTYMQTITGVSNAARYLNMDNAAAALAIEGLTGGAGSMNMLTQMGIYTSDPRTGKAYTQGQIFEQVAQRLTAGRGQASVEETLESIRRGNLGETIRNLGLSTDQQEMLKQFMVARASGQYMDLSNETAMSSLIDENVFESRVNPQLAGMEINALDTEMMIDVTEQYVAGMTQAVGIIRDINQALKIVPDWFKQLESTFSTLQGSQGGKFVEEFVSAMPGAISGMIALGTFAGMSGAISGLANALGAEPSTVPPGGSNSYVPTPDLGSGVPSFIRPTGGSISPNGYFGRRVPTNGVGSSDHGGIDFAVGVGTPVVASAAGQVTVATSGSSYGYYIIISHSGDFATVYAHMSSLGVTVGQNVSAGQQIGLSGNTGESTGPHLHFEIRKGGMKVNPAPYLGIAHQTNSSVSNGGTGGNVTLGSMDASTASSVSSYGGSGYTAAMTLSGSTNPTSLGASFFAGGGSMGTTYLSGAPSAKTGDPYVANDGPVNVHAGEAILTSEQAEDWRAMMRGSRRGGGNNVTIHVNLSNASDGEARRLANLVKQYIEEDDLLNNMGRR